MPRARLPYAERMRRHRAAFTLALELGITPREAEDELDRREAWARHNAAAQRLAARQGAPPSHTPIDPDRPQPWWQRD